MGVAREKQIELTKLQVRVVRKQNRAVAGPHDPAQRTLRITEFRRHILIGGEIGEKDARALLWGAKHCPVSNSLEGSVPIITRLEVES